MTMPTKPTNRPPDDRLEERLADIFDRASARAQADLADGRLAADAVDRGRRAARRAPILRSGLVLAAVAVLGLGTLWAVGGRQSPSPSPSLVPAPSVAAFETPHLSLPMETPYAEPSLLPTDANGSAIPQPSVGQGIPVEDSFPPTVDGATVYPVGPEADAAIAAAKDDSPILISGWFVGALRSGCSDFTFGSPTPNGIYFRDCAGTPLAATPDGPAALHVYSKLDGAAFPVTASAAEVEHVLIRVHVLDPDCGNVAGCLRKPVLDQTVQLGSVRLSPAVIAQTVPPNILPMADAIRIGHDAAAKVFADNYAITTFVLVRVQLGPKALFPYEASNGASYGTWVYVLTFDALDGNAYVRIPLDAVTGANNSSTSGSGDDGLSQP